MRPSTWMQRQVIRLDKNQSGVRHDDRYRRGEKSSLGDAEIVIVWGELNKTYIREHNIWKAIK